MQVIEYAKGGMSANEKSFIGNQQQYKNYMAPNSAHCLNLRRQVRNLGLVGPTVPTLPARVQTRRVVFVQMRGSCNTIPTIRRTKSIQLRFNHHAKRYGIGKMRHRQMAHVIVSSSLPGLVFQPTLRMCHSKFTLLAARQGHGGRKFSPGCGKPFPQASIVSPRDPRGGDEVGEIN